MLYAYCQAYRDLTSTLADHPAGGQGLRELSCPVELLQADRGSQSKEDAKLAQKLGQLQTFLAASLLAIPHQAQ